MRRCLLGLVPVLAVSSAVARPIQFVPLGDLPGGDNGSGAYAISSDGRVVVGSSAGPLGTEAFRWEAGVMTGLGDLPGGWFLSRAYGVSSDGSVVVGEGSVESGVMGHRAFAWRDGQMTALSNEVSAARGVSSLGETIVGRDDYHAVRWDGGIPAALAGAPSAALAVTPDAACIVGQYDGPNGFEACRWQNGVVEGLGDLAGGQYNSGAQDVSDNGQVVVGMSISASGHEAFRWEDGIMAGLGDFPGGDSESWAQGVSGDGSLVVGYGHDSGGELAFIWDAGHGLRSLREVLITDFGLNLDGWTLRRANDITPDGTTIVGHGTNPSGIAEAFLVTIPEPSGFLALLAILALVRRR